MKFFIGMWDLIKNPTKIKLFLIIAGFGIDIFIYSEFYQWKHGNTLLGLIISTLPTIIILSLMGDVSEVEKPKIIESRKENNLPMIINDRPHRHNMYGKRKPQLQLQAPIPEYIVVEQRKETVDSITTTRKLTYYGGKYNV